MALIGFAKAGFTFMLFVAMGLESYFQKLIDKTENSDVVTNKGTGNEGFYKPTRTILLRQLQLLKDLHQKPLAKPMCRAAWQYVTEQLPAEWLILTEQEKADLKKMLE